MKILLAGIALLVAQTTNPSPTPTFPAYHWGGEMYDPQPPKIARWFKGQRLVRCFPYLADALWGANITPPDASETTRLGVAQFILDGPLDPRSKIVSDRSGNGVRSVAMVRDGGALAYDGGSTFPPSPSYATHIVTGILSIDPSGVPSEILSAKLPAKFTGRLGSTLSNQSIKLFGNGHHACGYTARTVRVQDKMLAVTVVVDARDKIVAVVNDEWT